MEMRFDSLLDSAGQIAPFISCGKAAWKIWKRHAVRVFGIAHVNINGIEHGSFLCWFLRYLARNPACFKMLLSVGKGKSFFGCGTVTLPGLV